MKRFLLIPILIVAASSLALSQASSVNTNEFCMNPPMFHSRPW
jgi:hypothetical protein